MVKGGMSVDRATMQLRSENAQDGTPFQISSRLARKIGREAIAARTPVETGARERPELIPSVYQGIRPYRYEGTAHYAVYRYSSGVLLRTETRNVQAYSNREIIAGIARERLIEAGIRTLMDV